MNYDIILLNLREAREELDKLISMIISTDKPDEVEFEFFLTHTYHHLNFSWNIRNLETEKHKNLSESNFLEWSKFPDGAR